MRRYSKPTPEDLFPQIRIIKSAYDHLTELIKAYREHGISTSRSQLASAAILEIPLPGALQTSPDQDK